MQEVLHTVKYSSADSIKFEKVALKLGRSKRLVFSQMLDYFYRSKKDPIDVNDELLKTTILKVQKEHIGFVRTQESQLLIPIKREVSGIREVVFKINGLSGDISAGLKIVADKQASSNVALSVIVARLKSMDAKLERHEQLKKAFVFILQAYIRERESFGMMTPAKEKEELIKKTIGQINNL